MYSDGMKQKNWGMPSERDINRASLNVKEVGSCLLWTRPLNRYGYGEFRWKNRKFGAHRLFLIWQSGGVEYLDMMATHECRNRHCVRSEHLAWGTPKKNVDDKLRDGTQRRGSQIKNAVLSEKDVVSIYKSYHEQSLSGAELCAKFGVSSPTVQRIIKGYTWAHVTKGVALKKTRSQTENDRFIRTRRLSADTVLLVWSMWHESLCTMEEIEECTGVKAHNVRAILSKKIYKDITSSLHSPRRRRVNRRIIASHPGQKKSLSRRLSVDETQGIWIARHCEDIPQHEVASKFNVTAAAIRNVERNIFGKKRTEALICTNAACVICKRNKTIID